MIRLNSIFKNILKDSVLYGSAPVFVKLLNLILLPYYASVLNPSDFGNQILFIILYAVLLPFFNIGLDGAILRFYISSNSTLTKIRYLSTGFFLKLILSLLFVPILIISWNLIINIINAPDLNSQTILLLMCLVLVGDGISNQLAAKQKAERNIIVISKITFIAELIGVLSIVFCLYFYQKTFVALIIGQAASSIIKLLGFLKISISDISINEIDLNKAKNLLKYGLPMLPHKIQSKVLEFFVVFTLNKFLGVSNTGYYSLAKKILSPLSLGVEYFNKALIPIKLKNINFKNLELRKALVKFGILILGFYPLILSVGFILINYFLDEKWNRTTYFLFFASLPILTQALYYLINTGIEISPRQYIIPLASFISSIITICLIYTITRSENIYSLFIFQSIYFIILGFIIRYESRKYFSFYE